MGSYLGNVRNPGGGNSGGPRGGTLGASGYKIFFLRLSGCREFTPDLKNGSKLHKNVNYLLLYYLQQNSKKMLTWPLQLLSCQMSLTFDLSKYILNLLGA